MPENQDYLVMTGYTVVGASSNPREAERIALAYVTAHKNTTVQMRGLVYTGTWSHARHKAGMKPVSY